MLRLPLPAFLAGLVCSLAILPLCIGSTYFYIRSLPRIYASSALVKTALARDPVQLQTEFEIIQSKKVILPVLNSLIAQGQWTFSAEQSTYLSEDIAYQIFKGQHLRVQPYRNTKLIEITIFSEDPKQAKIAANALVSSYVESRENPAASIRNVELVSEAEEGLSPVKPNAKLYVTLSVVMGFFLTGIFCLILSIWFFLTRGKPGANPALASTI